MTDLNKVFTDIVTAGAGHATPNPVEQVVEALQLAEAREALDWLVRARRTHAELEAAEHARATLERIKEAK